MNKSVSAIFVVAWHGLKNDGSGIKDNGASYDWLIERDLVKEISKELYDKLYWHISNLYLIWQSEDLALDTKFNDIQAICKSQWYNTTNSLLISIHTNSAKGTGVEILSFLWYQPTQRFSDILLKHTSKTTWLRNRWLKDWKNYIVNKTDPLSVLFECGFIDNIKDRKVLKNNIESFSDWLFNWLKEYIWFEEEKDYKKLYEKEVEKLNKIKEFVKNI